MGQVRAVDKRTLQFILIPVLIFSMWSLLRLSMGPPPQQEVVENAGDPNAIPAEKPPGEEVIQPKPPEPDPEKPEIPEDPDEPPTQAAPRKFLTLGSLDGSSPYRILVTLDSQGAALQRVELAKYFDIEDRSGYLGALDLVPTQGGCLVQVVGPGSPAALATTPGGVAGLKEGDILTQVDDQEAKFPSDVALFLSKSKPKQEVKLAITRGGQKLVYTTILTKRPLALISPETHTFGDKGEEQTVTDPASLLMTLETVGKTSIKSKENDLPGVDSPRTENWHIADQGPDFVEFTFPISAKAAKALGASGKLELYKRYTIAPLANPATTNQYEEAPAYHLDFTLGVRNLGSEPISLAYRLDGLNGLPLEGWWYQVKLHATGFFNAAGARDVVYRFSGTSRQMTAAPLVVSEGKKLLDNNQPPEINLLRSSSSEAVDYIGVDAQFFAGMLIPQVEKDAQPPLFQRVTAEAVHDVRKIPRKRERTVNTSFSLASDPANVEPDGKLEQKFVVFLGPKDPEILQDPQYNLSALIEYGWPVFAVPGRALYFILGLLYQVSRNYFLAIVLLTVVVRCCMLPFSLRQAKSAAKMQEIAPEMQKVRDKHKDDPEAQNKAMQELYKKHNFNPLGGCLLAFFQLPVFIGLYRCLAVDIDLRDASMLPGVEWASNLAGPDRLFDWKAYTWPVISDEAEGWFGPYFNVLPFITLVLFLIQQKLFTPPATDEQTKMQQKMMTYMTVFMGVLFYKVPAGLCVYIITSSLWGIAERKLLPKPKPGDNTNSNPPPPPPPKPRGLPPKKKKK